MEFRKTRQRLTYTSIFLRSEWFFLSRSCMTRKRVLLVQHRNFKGLRIYRYRGQAGFRSSEEQKKTPDQRPSGGRQLCHRKNCLYPSRCLCEISETLVRGGAAGRDNRGGPEAILLEIRQSGESLLNLPPKHGAIQEYSCLTQTLATLNSKSWFPQKQSFRLQATRSSASRSR